MLKVVQYLNLGAFGEHFGLVRSAAEVFGRTYESNL
jgi:hypothetical protein